jgi:hypothetical protein
MPGQVLCFFRFFEKCATVTFYMLHALVHEKNIDLQIFEKTVSSIFQKRVFLPKIKNLNKKKIMNYIFFEKIFMQLYI